MLMSCSQISFGDKFLGEQPESSGATTAQMFSSRTEAEKVLNHAYRNLTYGLPTSLNNKLGGNVLESLTDLCQSFRDNISDGPVKLYYNGALSASNINGIRYSMSRILFTFAAAVHCMLNDNPFQLKPVLIPKIYSGRVL